MWLSGDSGEIRALEADLGRLNRRGIPFAVKNTLDRGAFAARGHAQANIRNGMTNRNKFTERSVRVAKATGLQVNRMASRVGSIADYMETQEFGGVKKPNGGEGVPIATNYAAGQGRGQAPRTRLPRKRNSMAAIQLRRGRIKAANRRQRNLIAVKEAAKTGHPFVWLDLGRKKGLFRVTGSERRPKVNMVYDMSERTVVIPANPWLRPAVDRARPEMPGFYAESLLFQLKRLATYR